MIRVLGLCARGADREARIQSQRRDEGSKDGWDSYHTGLLPRGSRDSTVVFACGSAYRGIRSERLGNCYSRLRVRLRAVATYTMSMLLRNSCQGGGARNAILPEASSHTGTTTPGKSAVAALRWNASWIRACSAGDRFPNDRSTGTMITS